MTIEAAQTTLCTRLEAAQGLLESTRRTIRDRPLDGDVILVDLFADGVDDALGWLEAAWAAAIDARDAASAVPAQFGHTRRGLGTCQEHAQRVLWGFESDLMRYDRLSDLAQCGRERGGEWRAWSDSVMLALVECERPLFEVNEALFRCWQELAGYAAAPAV